MAFAILAVMLFSLIVLSGCGEMSRNEKNLCYSFASKSYSYVPKCTTEQDCYNKVDPLFQTKLGYSQEAKLYEMKNSVARSWFYFNKANNELTNISSLCSTGNTGGLPGSINQLRFYFDNAFLELDQGMKKSFEIVTQEEHTLSEEKIDLVKEEKIFESLVELRQILSELSNPDLSQSSSDTYVSYYLQRAKNFNDSGAKSGLENLVEEKPLILSVYGYAEGTLLKELDLSKTGWFPPIYDVYKKGLNFVETRFYASESISALQAFPAYEFMKLYSDLGGSENSSLRRFTDLINRTSKNAEDTEKIAAENWKKLGEERNACKSLLEEIGGNEKYLELYSALFLGTVSSKPLLKNSFEKNDSNFLSLRDRVSAGTIKLGEKVSETKNLLNNFISIRKELEFQKAEFVENLSKACDNKAKEIKESDEKTSNASLLGIQQDAVFFASKTLSAEGTQKFDYCVEAIEKFELLRKGIENYELLEAKKIDLTADCFAYLEKIFKEVELRELKAQFEQLKENEVTKENILYFDEVCQNIKKQVENELGDDYVLIEITKNYARLAENIALLEKTQLALGTKEFSEKLDSFKTKLAGVEIYFSNHVLKIEEILPIKDSLNNSIKKTLQESDSAIDDAIIAYAQKNIAIIVLNENLTKTNNDSNSLNRLIIYNPFRAVQKPFLIKFAAEKFSVATKDDCVEFATCNENACSATFNSLPLGNSKFDFYSTEKTLTKESVKIIFASNETSLFQKNIELLSEKTFPQIIVETEKIGAPEKIIVIIDGKEALFSENGKALFFSAENASKATKMSVFFYVKNVISIETNMISDRKIDYQKQELNYSVKAKNNFGEALDATIVMPFEINSFIESSAIYDEQMTKKLHEIVDEKIVLKSQDFLPLESRTYSVFLKVSSVFDYYSQTLNSLKEKLWGLGEIEIYSEIENFLQLDFEESLASKAEDLIKKANLRISELNKQKSDAEMFYFTKQSLENQLIELENAANSMELAGLSKQAAEAREILLAARIKIDSNNLSEFSKAQQLISEKSFSIDKAFLTEAENYWKQIRDLNISSAKIELLKQQFFEEKELFEEQYSINPISGMGHFVALKKIYDELIIEKNMIEKEHNPSTMNEKVAKLISECFEKTGFLERQLLADESALIKAKFIQPITLSRLKKIELSLIDINSSNVSVDEKEKLINELLVELNDAIDSLKRQAIKAYNAGVDAGYESEIMLEGKEMMDSNQYTNAIIVLSKGTGLSPLETVPFAGFVPIIIIAIVAFVLKQKIGKKEKQADENKKIISESWEN
jgi:hypothetical protein